MVATAAAEFVQLIPNLRRYARLLTGHQRLGDVLVVTAMQWIASEPKTRLESRDQREQVYTFVTDLWRSPVNDRLQQLAASDPMDEGHEPRLGVMVSVARAAFVLVYVEGFSHEAAAKVLHVDQCRFNAMLGEAHVAISHQLATDVLIIEDELLIAFQLEELMSRLGHHVTSVVRTHRHAVKHARLHPPKLILADINLADGSSGIEAVNEILTGVSVPVVFITAYPERLLTGIRPEPAFVVSKPFKVEEIQAVVGQALFFDLKARFSSATAAIAIAGELVEGRMGDHLYN